MTWALLWSQRQNALHVEPLDAALSSARKSYADDSPGDYRILFIGPRELVEGAADAMRNTMAARQSDRTQQVGE